MIYIIFSDVHSNLEAMQAFLEMTQSISHDKKICLGDMVGYGADPNPVLELIRRESDIVLAGNHDFGVIGKADTSYFNPYAYSACMWTRHELTEENRGFLDSLDVERVENGITWIHSSPFEPEEWHYVVSSEDGHNFGHFFTQMCFVGHSHRPLVLEEQPNRAIDEISGNFLNLKKDCRYLVNVGSLGQPRDGNPQPTFVIYDDQKGTLEFKRFDYDFKTTQKKILKNGLPPFLAERLSVGQ